MVGDEEQVRFMRDHLEEIVNNRTNEINERNRELSEFAFVNAHMLRAPLTRIMGLTSLLSKRGYMDKKQL